MIRCDFCGNFISYRDLDEGKAYINFIYPDSEYIFAGEDGEMMGKTTLNTALSNMKLEFRMHTLRATASDRKSVV